MDGRLHSDMKLQSGKFNKTQSFLARRALLAHQYLGIYMKEKSSKVFLKHQFKSRPALPLQ